MFSAAFAILTLLTFGQASWRHPSPHQVRFITVESTIKLEFWTGVEAADPSSGSAAI